MLSLTSLNLFGRMEQWLTDVGHKGPSFPKKGPAPCVLPVPVVLTGVKLKLITVQIQLSPSSPSLSPHVLLLAASFSKSLHNINISSCASQESFYDSSLGKNSFTSYPPLCYSRPLLYEKSFQPKVWISNLKAQSWTVFHIGRLIGKKLLVDHLLLPLNITCENTVLGLVPALDPSRTDQTKMSHSCQLPHNQL
jgi:hypothetical protein